MKTQGKAKTHFDTVTFYDYGREHFRLIRKHFPKKKRVKVLDLGAGRGHLYHQLKKLKQEIEYTGLELSETQVKTAQKDGLHVIHADLNKVFPLNETFDIIIASEVIEHIYDTDAFLEECKRLLVPDGVLIITTPNIASLGARIKFLFGIRPAAIDIAVRDTSGHIHGFTIADMKYLCKRNGLRCISATGLDFWLPGISAQSKYFGKFCLFLARAFPTLSANLFFFCRNQSKKKE